MTATGNHSRDSGIDLYWLPLGAGGRSVRCVVASVPSLTWGRDELRTGDVWNSNSLTSWLLARTGHDMTTIRPPSRGRAPGWHAGAALASRELAALRRGPG
jgi:hypothetical protein